MLTVTIDEAVSFHKVAFDLDESSQILHTGSLSFFYNIGLQVEVILGHYCSANVYIAVFSMCTKMLLKSIIL